MEKRKNRTAYTLSDEAFDVLEKLKDVGVGKEKAVSLSIEFVGENVKDFLTFFNKKTLETFDTLKQ